MANADKIEVNQSKFLASDCTSHFNDTDIRRYLSKLNRLDISDPYRAPGVLFKTLAITDKENIPDLQYPDIYNYLIDFPSQYTGATLKAYKGLEAYRFVQSGFVMPLYVWAIPPKNAAVITARVHHSQRLNDPQLKPWVMIRNDGVVLGGHCNCMAGLGECCSHVSAVLFKLWIHNDMQDDDTLSVTSKKCKWSQPSADLLKAVEYLEGRYLACNETQRLKKVKTSDNQNVSPTCPPLTAEELSQFYTSISKCQYQNGKLVKPAILSVIPNHAQNYVPTVIKLDLPPPLSSLYDSKNRELSTEELQEKAERILEKMSITEEQSVIIDEETQQQAKCSVWFNYRSGRITGSNFKAATRTDVTQPSVSLIQKICYPRSQSFSTQATRWGCNHEESARRAYEELQQQFHTTLTLERAGFKISSQHPFIGATPDGYVSCDCCGSGVIEIKCPYCAKDLAIDTAAKTLKNFCLTNGSNGNLELDRSHTYYYQVQMQLFVTNRSYCDFILWTERDGGTPFIERITLDMLFIGEALSKVETFFKRCIIPELMAKVYTMPIPVQSLSTCNGQKCCYCREPEAGEMLECSSGSCVTKKFHKKCLGLKRVVKNWVCPCCRKILNKQKRDTQKRQK